MNRLFFKWAGVLGVLFLSACASQRARLPGPAGIQPEQELARRVASRSPLAVLFVGNSLSFSVPKEFLKLAVAKGKSTRVGLCATNGWSLQRHASDPATLDQIREGHWDIVVLQEYSEIPALNPHARAKAMLPPLRKLVSEVRLSGAVPVLYQTWGCRDGSRRRAADDFYAMSGRVREGYRVASENAGHLVVVPVGDAWEREFSQGRGDRLFLSDGKHPAPYGNVVTAGVFYQTFFGK